MRDVHHVGRFGPQLRDVLLFDDDEDALRGLVALDDVLGADLLVAVRTPFLDLDRRVTLPVKLAERHVRAGVRRREHADRDGDEAQSERSFPRRAGGHGGSSGRLWVSGAPACGAVDTRGRLWGDCCNFSATWANLCSSSSSITRHRRIDRLEESDRSRARIAAAALRASKTRAGRPDPPGLAKRPSLQRGSSPAMPDDAASTTLPDWLEPMAATLTRSASPARVDCSSASSTASACSRSRTAPTCGCCRATACRRTRLPGRRRGRRRAAGRRRRSSTAKRRRWGRAGRGRVPRLRRPVARRTRRHRAAARRAARAARRAAARAAARSASSRSTTPSRGSAPAREGWEGVIAKRRDSPYEHRRSPHWLKMKCEATQELVVGGFTDPQGGRVGLGALLVGYFDGDDFVFAGKVGTGFDTHAAARPARAARRARDPERRRSRGRSACRACARTGCGRRSSSRWRSSSGPCTASCGTRGCSACATTSRRATSCGSRRDHASREGAVPGRRDHQGRARGVLRGGRADHAAAPPRPAR